MASPRVVLGRGVGIPSDRAWIDPALIARNLYVQTSDWVSGGSGNELIATLNIYRWAIYFTAGPAFAGAIKVCPWSDGFTVPGWTVTAGTFLRFTTTLDGPLVSGEWYGVGLPGESLRVVEIIRRA